MNLVILFAPSRLINMIRWCKNNNDRFYGNYIHNGKKYASLAVTMILKKGVCTCTMYIVYSNQCQQYPNESEYEEKRK